jgi:hypothetical protein
MPHAGAPPVAGARLEGGGDRRRPPRAARRRRHRWQRSARNRAACRRRRGQDGARRTGAREARRRHRGGGGRRHDVHAARGAHHARAWAALRANGRGIAHGGVVRGCDDHDGLELRCVREGGRRNGGRSGLLRARRARAHQRRQAGARGERGDRDRRTRRREGRARDGVRRLDGGPGGPVVGRTWVRERDRGALGGATAATIRARRSSCGPRTSQRRSTARSP